MRRRQQRDRRTALPDPPPDRNRTADAAGSHASKPSANSPEFILFLATVRPKLRRLLSGCRVASEDAEDLLQDALLALLARWDQMDDVGSREAWLLGTLRNKVSRYWRHREREQRFLAAVLTETLETAEPPPQARHES